MIYYVTLEVRTADNLSNTVPRSMRHLLKIVEKGYVSGSPWKYRKLVGWLNQKQFNKLISDCFLTACKINGAIEHFDVMFKRRIKNLNYEYTARVRPYPQKYKRSGQPHKPPTVMEFRNNKQKARIKKAILWRYR